MITAAIIAVIVAAAASGAIAWWRWRRGNGIGASPQVPSIEFEPEDPYKALRAEEDRRVEDQRLKQDAVRDLLQHGDPELAQLLMSEAGRGEGSVQSASHDDEAIRRIAERITWHMLNVLSYANRSPDQFEKIELEAVETLEPSAYPADTFDIVPMLDSEMDRVIPEDLASDDDVFWAALAEDGLRVITYYEFRQEGRRLYILIDVSGSMATLMSSDSEYTTDESDRRETRIQWAAGVALKLMMRARQGNAEYILRLFGSTPHEPRAVRTSEEADKMASELLRLHDSGSGTDIQLALQAAVGDIQNAGTGDVETSDILLISDGQSYVDEAWLQETFGEDIRLHVAQIGIENPVFANEEVSTSYAVYRA